MSAIKKLILPGPRAIKKLRVSPSKKEKASPNSLKKDGLTLLGSCIPMKSSIPGGACELGEELRILDGDWTTSWSTLKHSSMLKSQGSTMISLEVIIAPLNLLSSFDSL